MRLARETGLRGPQKAAVLMVLLGDDAAKTVYQHLPQEQLRLLAEEIAALERISPETAAKVLEEYDGRTVREEAVAQGGPDFATELLMQTFGPAGGRALSDRVVRSQDVTARNFEAMQKANPEQLVRLLEQEHPQTVAVVLAHLRGNMARRILLLFPEEMRTQAVRRLAEMRRFSPEVLKNVSAVLRRKLESCHSDRGAGTVADRRDGLEARVTCDTAATMETGPINYRDRVHPQKQRAALAETLAGEGTARWKDEIEEAYVV